MLLYSKGQWNVWSSQWWTVKTRANVVPAIWASKWTPWRTRIPQIHVTRKLFLANWLSLSLVLPLLTHCYAFFSVHSTVLPHTLITSLRDCQHVGTTLEHTGMVFGTWRHVYSSNTRCKDRQLASNSCPLRSQISWSVACAPFVLLPSGFTIHICKHWISQRPLLY